jgi:hypothetical protein
LDRATKKEAKPRPEKYEKNELKINGTFAEARSVFFKKPKIAKDDKKKLPS